VERHGIPPQRFLKLNFDEASRGNPGPGGAEGIFRDSKGEIISLYTVVLGHTTNNRAKLAGLLAGLQWAKVRGYSTLIVEGDSKLLVSALGKIINSASPYKVSKNWRLFVGLTEVALTIHGTSAIIPSHDRRWENVVADYLANVALGQAQSGPNGNGTT
jgi:ribonuclease HI